MKILVFKTNIRYKKHLAHVVPYLENIKGINTWNVDLKDRDKVLRVEALGVTTTFIKTVLQEAGYFCEELQD